METGITTDTAVQGVDAAAPWGPKIMATNGVDCFTKFFHAAISCRHAQW